MLTKEQIKKERPEMTDSNIEAFLRFCHNFNCLDSKSYQEAHNRIDIEMERIGDEMDRADTEEEQNAIFLKNFFIDIVYDFFFDYLASFKEN